MNINKRFLQRVAVVTGGARGVGKAYCEGLVTEGAAVVIADVNYKRAQSTATELIAAGGQAIAVEVDVASEDSVRRMYEEALDHFQRVDFLINNAAIMLDVDRPFKPFWELDWDEWTRVMAVNAGGVYLCCKHVKPIMERLGQGRIVNISSDAIWKGYDGQLAYLASLGSTVWFASVFGSDTQALKISELFLQMPRISTYLHSCQGRLTTTKTRIIARGQQILRIDREEHHQIPPEAEASIINWVYEHRGGIHACILSDYAKGVLHESLISSLIAICKQAHIPVIVDPKGNRYSKYRGATIVTPNLLEANRAAGNEEGELTLEEVADLLRGDIGSGALLITQGAQGMSLFTNGSTSIHISAKHRDVHDVTGAGDTVVAVLTLFLTAGADLETAARLANYAAGMVVGKIGTACVSLTELCEAL